MRVKICGITNVADAVLAAEAGADAIGLNFVSGPRQIGPAAARDILRSLPPSLTPVALVRLDERGLADELRGFFRESRISHLQLYGWARGQTVSEAGVGGEWPGSWAADSLMAAGFRLMPALAVKDAGFTKQLAEWGLLPSDRRPAAVVLDAYDPGRAGGTGRSFRWEWVSQGRSGSTGWPPILLAGGLNPENVAEAVRIARPDGVDVSSGVERADAPGRKDAEKVRVFVRNAREALQTL